MDPTHSRKRSIAFLSDKSTNDTLQPPAERQIATPSKRLQNSRGQAVPQNEVLPNYNAQRLLNNLAFTRLYVTANFQNYWPSMSPVILCLVHEQNDLYVALW